MNLSENTKYSQFICEICNSALSRGYCAICGRLVCGVCSDLIGYARICKYCKKQFGLSTYDQLKEFLKSLAGMKKLGVCRLKKVFSRENEELRDKIFVIVGIDDIDSPIGMCTTYVAAKIAYQLLGKVEFIDFPLLVRLNPNIPAKTRGNAAVSLRFIVDMNVFHKIKSVILSFIEENSHVWFRKTNTGVVIYSSNYIVIPRILHEFYKKTVKDVVSVSDVFRTLDRVNTGNIEAFSWGNSRGLIGALAAVGARFKDWTYELLAYREAMTYTRNIDEASVIRFDKYTKPYTFANVDKSRILIVPRGLDPVLYGIRGDFPETLIEGLYIIKSEDPILWCIFKTNQATDEHINVIQHPSEARPYLTVKLKGVVYKLLKERGAIVILLNSDDWLIKVYVYHPLGTIRKFVQELKWGDLVEVVGAVITQNVFERVIVMNLERLRIIDTLPLIIERNPFCPKCLTRLKSKGKNLLECPKCGFKLEKTKIILLEERNLKDNISLFPSPSAYRHLTKPPIREYFSKLKRNGIIKSYMIYPFVGVSKIFHKVRMNVIEPKIV